MFVSKKVLEQLDFNSFDTYKTKTKFENMYLFKKDDLSPLIRAFDKEFC